MWRRQTFRQVGSTRRNLTGALSFYIPVGTQPDLYRAPGLSPAARFTVGVGRVIIRDSGDAAESPWTGDVRARWAFDSVGALPAGPRTRLAFTGWSFVRRVRLATQLFDFRRRRPVVPVRLSPADDPHPRPGGAGRVRAACLQPYRPPGVPFAAYLRSDFDTTVADQSSCAAAGTHRP
jgi:hypothetical protein